MARFFLVRSKGMDSKLFKTELEAEEEVSKRKNANITFLKAPKDFWEKYHGLPLKPKKKFWD